MLNIICDFQCVFSAIMQSQNFTTFHANLTTHEASMGNGICTDLHTHEAIVMQSHLVSSLLQKKVENFFWASVRRSRRFCMSILLRLTSDSSCRISLTLPPSIRLSISLHNIRPDSFSRKKRISIGTWSASRWTTICGAGKQGIGSFLDCNMNNILYYLYIYIIMHNPGPCLILMKKYI